MENNNKSIEKYLESIIYNKKEFLKRVLIYSEGIDGEFEEFFLKSTPHFYKYEVLFIYLVEIKYNERKINVVVTNEMLDNLEITKDELHATAYKNTRERYQMTIVSTNEIMSLIKNDAKYNSLIKECNIVKSSGSIFIGDICWDEIDNLLFDITFYDRVGVCFKEPYYLIVLSPFLLCAYPASRTNFDDLKEKYALLNIEFDVYNAIFYYKNGEVEVFKI